MRPQFNKLFPQNIILRPQDIILWPEDKKEVKTTVTVKIIAK